MKNFVVMNLFLALLALPAHASNYSSLTVEKRTQVETKLRDFLPRINEASLAVLQDLFSQAKAPLHYKQRLLDLKFESGDTFETMLERQAKKVPEVAFTFRGGLYLNELIDITNNGLKLMDLFSNEKEMDPADFLRALNKELSVDSDGDETYVTIDGLGFPHCTTSVILAKTETRIEENCD